MLTEILEKSLNRNLPRSPRARELALLLTGRRLGIEVLGTGPRLTLESTGTRLTLRKAEPEWVTDARVSGSPLALLSLAGRDPEAAVRRGAVEITGDPQLAQRFRELVLLLRPDVEEELSRWVGDAPAHHGMRLARGALDYARRAAATGAHNVAEFLSHESRDLVPLLEAESLFRDIERLRDDVDRIEARIAALARRRGAGGDGV
jgi:ubiquinone biosynthesis protein UbiJ